MNFTYTITWPNPHDAEAPHQFYNALRAGVVRNNSQPGGARFPFDCPYEVGLARSLEEPPGWMVAILAVQVADARDAQGADTVPLLVAWIDQCRPGGLPGEASLTSAPANHIKLASELGAGYKVVDSFGTFAGEPTLKDLEREAPTPPAETPPPQKITIPADPAAKVTPIPPAPQPQPPPKPISKPAPRPTAQASPAAGIPGEVTCLRVGLIAGGALLGLAGLALAAVLALAQSSPGASSGPGELVLALLCCPLPALVLGAGLIVLGAILPKLLKR